MLGGEPVALPEQGLGKEEVLGLLKGFKEGDADYKESKTWSLVYYLDFYIQKPGSISHLRGGK